MRDRFFWGPRRVDQYCCHGEADLLLRCFYFSAFHAVLEMRSNNATGGGQINYPNFSLVSRSTFKIKIQSLLSGHEQPVILEEDDAVVEKMVQLCPLCKSWPLEWIMKLIFLQMTFTSGSAAARDSLSRIAFPQEWGKTLYWMQVNSVLSSCLGKWPLQTSCLSKALMSSALIALTGSGRLFISPFSQNHHCDWFEGDWSLAVWSIQPTVVKMDTKGIRGLCVRVCVT